MNVYGRNDPRWERHSGERPPADDGGARWSGGPGAWSRPKPGVRFDPPPAASTNGMFKLVKDVPGLARHEAPVHSRGHSLEDACRIANDHAVVGAPPDGMGSWPHGEWVHAMPLRVAPHTVEDDAVHAASVSPAAQKARRAAPKN